MATHDTIVIGASAGGVQASTKLIAGVPAHLPAAVFLVIHISAHSPGVLPQIIGRASRLPVAHGIDGEEIRPGRIYVAPPDLHLAIEKNRVRLLHGPKENLHRPSIDTLFRSAARWAGPRTIGVVLTGARDDGTVGMRAIQKRGGITIVQDPLEAPFPSMPMNVMKDIDVDYSLPLRDIARQLAILSRQPANEEGAYPVSEDVEIETRIAQQQMEGDELLASVEKLGKISRLTCPDCQGALWEISDEDILRFRCHVGHALSADSLNEGQGEMLETALWSAVRALEEQLILARRIIERARRANHIRAVRLFEERARQAEAHGSAIRELLLSGKKGGIAEALAEEGD
jgi:two-component system, chemotaxis family, protein-glutamate methylesterase/glutaminase